MNLTLKPGVDVTLPAGQYNLVGDVPYFGTITMQPGTEIVGTQRLYFRDDTAAQRPCKLIGGKLNGPKLYIDRIGGKNQNILIENVEFVGGSGIESHSGLATTTIRNCLFRDHPSHPIYGVNGYDGLVIANNDFLGNRGGIHWDAPVGSNSRGLLIEQCYWEGLTAIGIELQTESMGKPIIQDVTFANLNIVNPKDCAPISVPLDAGNGAIVRRCRFPMATPTWQIEGGGYGAIYEDNYSGACANFVVVTDARGTWAVNVQNNRVMGGKITANNTLGMLLQSNNGPDTQLTWDINRKPGRRGYRLGIDPVVQTVTKAEYDALATKLAGILSERDALRGKLSQIHGISAP